MSTATFPAKSAPSAPSPPENRTRAYAELATAHQSQIRIYVSSLGVASCSVDDFTQDALVIAYERFDTFELGTNFVGWVCRIARNLIRDDRAKTSRRYRILNTVVTDILVTKDPGEDLADREESNRNRHALRTCMEGLPDDTREIVSLRYRDGMEPTTVALQLGIRADALRQRLWRVRQSLRRCVSQRLRGEETA